jgi:AP-3 complex subunit mu
MIQSLFILSPTGEIVIERHFRGMTPRSVCDHFWERASESLNHHGGVSTACTGGDPLPLYDTVPPIMEITIDDENHQGSGVDGENSIFLFSILRDGLSYLAACPGEISPLLVIEFLHRVADIFVDYFGSPVDESSIKDNFSTVYQLLEEMVDHGWPLMTEPNALQAIIRPPDVMGKVSVIISCLIHQAYFEIVIVSYTHIYLLNSALICRYWCLGFNCQSTIWNSPQYSMAHGRCAS